MPWGGSITEGGSVNTHAASRSGRAIGGASQRPSVLYCQALQLGRAVKERFVDHAYVMKTSSDEVLKRRNLLGSEWCKPKRQRGSHHRTIRGKNSALQTLATVYSFHNARDLSEKKSLGWQLVSNFQSQTRGHMRISSRLPCFLRCGLTGCIHTHGHAYRPYTSLR